MRKTNVKMICEAGLFCAIYAVFILICRASAGLLESLLFFIMPLPMIFFTIRYKTKEGFLLLIATAIVCFLISPLSTIFYILPACFVGLLYALLKKKNVKELLQIITMVLASFVVNISTMFIFANIFEYDIYKDFGSTINAILKLFDMLFKSNLASVKVAFYVDLLTPSIILVLSLIEGYLMHMVSSLMLEKFKINQKKILPFFLLQLPLFLGLISFIFVVGGIFIFIFVKNYNNNFYQMSRFVLPFVFLGYILLFIQGISRLACILMYKNKVKFFPFALILALLLNSLVIILGFFAIFNDNRDKLLYNVKWKGDA